MAEAHSFSDEQVAETARDAVDRALARNIPGLPTAQDLSLDVGPTPREPIHARGTLKLYHYEPAREEVYRVPVLLVMSLVSRSYIFDLAEGQSLVAYLLSRGFDVYLIDWGVPRPEHSKLSLADYVCDFIPECVQKVCEDSGEPDVTLLGYCMGGTMAAMHAALFPDGPVANLVCIATPVNSDGMELQRRWTDPAHFDIDRVVDELGNVPPELVSASIEMLRPLQRTTSRIKLLQNVGDDAFVQAHLRFERWTSEQIPFPGETARQMVKDFLLGNKLMKGEFQLRDRVVDLHQVRAPFLHVLAQHDHLVPAAASRDLLHLVGSEDKSEIVVKGGHVSLIAGGNAVYRMWPKLDRWLAGRSV